jgi:membrane associated rhomboid family serine protease
MATLHRQPVIVPLLVAANVAVFLWTLSQGSSLSGIGRRSLEDLALYGPFIDVRGEWWRIFSHAFAHSGLIHIGFNMFLLWRLGEMLEPRLGRVGFSVLYTTSVIGGAAGALVLDPLVPGVGASGGVFGLMGALFLLQRQLGVNPWASGIGTLIVVNVILSFALSNVSVGGHLGGLVAGGAAGWVLTEGRRVLPVRWMPEVAVVVMGIALFGLSLWAAGQWPSRV